MTDRKKRGWFRERKNNQVTPQREFSGDRVAALRLLRLAEAFEKLARTLGLEMEREGAVTVAAGTAESLEWQSRYYESREALGIQLHEISSMLTGIAGEMKEVKDVTEQADWSLRKLLGRQGLKADYVKIAEYANGQQEAWLTLSTVHGRYRTAREIAELVSKGTRRKWRPSDEGRSVVAGEPVTIKLEEETAYRAIHGVARQTKEGEPISGDTFSVVSLSMGQLLLGLSDGMGSGENAFSESAMATDLLEQLLSTGFSLAAASKIINSVLVLCRPEQHPTTLDICVIDQHTGFCQILKQGACPTLVKRGTQVLEIDCPTLPAGMLQGTAPEPIYFRLEHGDILVMVTDGVVDGLWGDDKEETLRRLLAASDSVNPKELSTRLLDWALKKGTARDDMTVLAVGIWKK